MQIHWTASYLASCFHAAWAVAGRQPTTDPPLVDALAHPAAAVHQELSKFSWCSRGTDAVWQTLIAMAADVPEGQFGHPPASQPASEPAEAADAPPLAGSSPDSRLARRRLATAIVHACGDEADERSVLEGRLAELFGQIEAAVHQARPRLDSELTLRIGPLRQLWEARGPGLLRRIAHWTDDSVLVDSAEVIMVHPVLGGYGRAHLPQHCVRLEAMLTNAVAELPEIVRLGWLLSQLHEMWLRRAGKDAQTIAALAMLPATLQAAEEVELARFDPRLLEQAVSLWKLPQPLGQRTATELWDWWQDYRRTRRPAWTDAVTALCQTARG